MYFVRRLLIPPGLLENQAVVFCDNVNCRSQAVLPIGVSQEVISGSCIRHTTLRYPHANRVYLLAGRCHHAQTALHALAGSNDDVVLGNSNQSLNEKLLQHISCAAHVTSELKGRVEELLKYAGEHGGIPIVQRPVGMTLCWTDIMAIILIQGAFGPGSGSNDVLSVLLADPTSNGFVTQAWYGRCGRLNVSISSKTKQFHCPCRGSCPVYMQ